MDLLVREAGLVWARARVEVARVSALAEKTRLETNPGLLKSLSARAKRERQEGIKAAIDYKAHYDAQIEKVDSLILLLGKEIGRWLDCCLKTRSPDYIAGLAGHAFPEDWGRFAYHFELNAKAFRLELENLRLAARREGGQATRAPFGGGDLRRLLPAARLIEIDVECLNRVVAEQARASGRRSDARPRHTEYGWCEIIEQLGTLSPGAAFETLQELTQVSGSFLTAVLQDIKREQATAEEKAARAGRRAAGSFLNVWWDRLRPVVERDLKPSEPEAMIAETEALLLDGEFSGRFNQHLIDSIVRHAAPAAPTGRAAEASPARDEEIKALRKSLEQELEEVARIKIGLAKRERVVREQEQAFAEKRQREQAELDEARARLTAQEADFAARVQAWEETQRREQADLDALKAEQAARTSFIEEGEQRLLAKGQEQVERLAELEQREEDLDAARRELNALRKELGLPVEPLRTTPVDEFNE